MFGFFFTDAENESATSADAPLTRFGTADTSHPQESPIQKLSRFTSASRPNVSAEGSNVKIVPARPERPTVVTPRDRQRMPKSVRERFDEMAHLHSEGSIPVSVLQRALPGRFENDNRDFIASTHS